MFSPTVAFIFALNKNNLKFDGSPPRHIAHTIIDTPKKMSVPVCMCVYVGSKKKLRKTTIHQCTPNKEHIGSSRNSYTRLSPSEVCVRILFVWKTLPVGKCVADEVLLTRGRNEALMADQSSGRSVQKSSMLSFNFTKYKYGNKGSFQ